jgi:hypothetical protein
LDGVLLRGVTPTGFPLERVSWGITWRGPLVRVRWTVSLGAGALEGPMEGFPRWCSLDGVHWGGSLDGIPWRVPLERFP